MLDHMLWIWGIFFILCIVTEASTTSLVAIWFMPGTLIAIILSLLSVPVWIQVLQFLLISVVLLLLTRRLSARLLKNKPLATNADRVIGEEGIVTEVISDLHETGQVRVLGQIWTARSYNPEKEFAVGDTVKVLRIEGVRLIVVKA